MVGSIQVDPVDGDGTEEDERRHISFNLDDDKPEEEDLLAPAGGLRMESYGLYLESIDDQKPIEPMPSSQVKESSFISMNNNNVQQKYAPIEEEKKEPGAKSCRPSLNKLRSQDKEK